MGSGYISTLSSDSNTQADNMDEISKELNHQEIMHSVIQRIATGPHLSKDISFAEARAGIQGILGGHISPVQSAIFLIALRMKRETEEENAGILQGIMDCSDHAVADVDAVLDIADPYDGWNRGLPVAAFLPAVMAAAGMPSISHGLRAVGPKYGATHHMVLKEAGRRTDLTLQQAVDQISNADIGWSYLDQSIYCPVLHGMFDFRREIIKRTAITTVEVLIGPVRGRNTTHIMTGYVHKAYPPLYASLARHGKFDSAMIVRGVEGSVIPSLQQPARLFYYHDMGEGQEINLNPAELGFEHNTRCVPLPDSIEKARGGTASNPQHIAEIARLAAEAGLQALNGGQGAAYDSLVYSGAIAWRHLNRDISLSDAADHIRNVLDNGQALKRFQAAQ